MLRPERWRSDFGPTHAVAIGHERGGVLVATLRLLRRPLRVLASIAAFGFGLISYVYLTLPDVRPLATTNPASTAFMRLREQEAAADGLKPRLAYRWVSYWRISPNLKRAVLVAEDSAF